MKENEFDIQVRNLLQDAQESVSPSVWEGVQAGLVQRHRAAAFWRWAGAVAAAAAILTGVVLLWPAAQQEHSNPTILAETSTEDIPQAPLVQEDVLPAEEETLVPAATPSPRPARLAKVEEKAAPAVKESVSVAPAPEETSAAPAEQPEPEEKAVAAAPAPKEVTDQAAFNRLAFEEGRKNAVNAWSMAVSGNLEDKRRGTVNSFVPPHYSAPLLSAPEGIYNENPEISFSLPFSVGVGLNWQFARHWAVGLGLRYTNLSRTFVGDYKGSGFILQQTDIDNHQHWLGIPVNAYYAFVNTGRWRVHVFAGGSMEFLVDNDYLVHSVQKDLHYHQHGSRPQFSAGLGLGVEFKITPWLGLYLDPSFRYYFRPDLQPRSLRTIQPLRFDLEAGLRFSLGK